MRGRSRVLLPPASDAAYAIAGAGGSIDTDPDARLGFAYTPNLMGFGSPSDPGEVALRTALYRSLEPTRKLGNGLACPSENGMSE